LARVAANAREEWRARFSLSAYQQRILQIIETSSGANRDKSSSNTSATATSS